jgi:hypothetical protein
MVLFCLLLAGVYPRMGIPATYEGEVSLTSNAVFPGIEFEFIYIP